MFNDLVINKLLERANLMVDENAGNKCSGGIDISIHEVCPRCGATANDTCPYNSHLSGSEVVSIINEVKRLKNVLSDVNPDVGVVDYD